MGADYDSMNAMWHLVWPAVAFTAVLFAALVVRGLLKRVLRRRMRAPDALASFLKAVRGPSLLWAAVVALWLAIEVSELPRRITAQLEVAFQVALILSVTFTLVCCLRYIVTISADHATVASPCGNQRVRCESARKIASGWRRWCKAARRRSGSR